MVVCRLRKLMTNIGGFDLGCKRESDLIPIEKKRIRRFFLRIPGFRISVANGCGAEYYIYGSGGYGPDPDTPKKPGYPDP
ncbi:hypothetical protein AT5G09445 [Arabidopsis thaliana]|uniref:Uncharacterized protein n=1 Tax=Arabidopsis thaliana TaxID=3702 RepID=A8MQR8_ARATH|nr:uncharacterized protein AT5G09445 [Arabidopsis thaliana]AED91394.1 hypothetical protein AT5G09445 [Arabidopsis thaliana]|eukprot:NP_001078553.1 hypothetical protein AT5G09445 [Arabidopsis thaliana]